MGFFFDWLEICLIILPVFGPLIASLDFGSPCQWRYGLPTVALSRHGY